MSEVLKLGLMGYGFAGSTFHAPVIAHSGRTAVAVIATSQAERARADYPDADIVPDFDALLARDDISCIVIATPNDTHFDLARRALAAGKHVVVDKPVTLRALIADGKLGRVTHYESHFDRFRPVIPKRWREEAAHGGGLLFDLGPHLIDQALALFGAPQSISATVKQQRDNAQVPDYVHLQLHYADKEVILHASALTALPPPRFTVHGTRGSYVINGLDVQEDQLKAGLRPGDPDFGKNAAGLLREADGDTATQSACATQDGDYVGFYRALAASVLDGKPFPIAAQDAVDVMTIIDLAIRSDAEGRRLQFLPAGDA